MHFPIQKKLPKHFQVQPLSESLAALQAWLETDYGNYLLNCEKQIAKELGSSFTGYHMMELGVAKANVFSNSFDHSHRFVLGLQPAADVGAVVDFEELPLPSETLDSVFLHHALEFSTAPTSLLQEVNRVLMPGGHILIALFHPMGCVGLSKVPALLIGNNPVWRHHYLRVQRIVDWLSLFGMQVVQRHKTAYIPPLNKASWLDKLSKYGAFAERHQLLGAGVTMLLAQKRVSRLITPNRRQWQTAIVPKTVLPTAKDAAKTTHKNESTSEES